VSDDGPITLRPNPCLFVVGCPRSGTTLLQRMLDSHPLLAVVNDAHFIHRGPRRLDRFVDPILTDEIVDRVTRYHAFDRLGLRAAQVSAAAARSRTYAAFVGALYDEFAANHGKVLAGDKTPHYVRYLPFLRRLFPASSTVHIVRDGRDVALSMLDWARPGLGPGRFPLWQSEPLGVAALSWRWHVTTGVRDGHSCFGARYHEVLYERLVDDPDTELQTLSELLEIPYAGEMLAYHEGKTRSAQGLSAKSAWLPPVAGLRDWRRQMAERDVEIFEALAGDVLSSFGYEREFVRISARAEAHAARCRERWEQEVRTRNRQMASRLELRIDPVDLVGHTVTR
jgi:Sulfotransferase family